jgi:hypothetical protein
MGLISNFFPCPYPLGGRIDVADDRLPTRSDVDAASSGSVEQISEGWG